MANSRREKFALVYPKHWFKPEEWLTFIEVDGFLDDWKSLGLGDRDLQCLQIMIMSKPKGNPVITGTGGLRKMRFSTPQLHRGKRGAGRVLYVYFQEFGIVLLVAAYGKNEQDDFRDAHKVAYRKLIARQKRIFAKRTVR